MEFEPKYRVVHFDGEWVRLGQQREGQRRALAVLKEAVRECANRDMRAHEHTLAALEYLGALSHRPALFRSFAKALEVMDPGQRYYAARAAYLVIVERLRG